MCNIDFKIKLHKSFIEMMQNAEVNNHKFIESVVGEFVELRRDLRRELENLDINDERVKQIEDCVATFTFRFEP